MTTMTAIVVYILGPLSAVCCIVALSCSIGSLFDLGLPARRRKSVALVFLGFAVILAFHAYKSAETIIAHASAPRPPYLLESP